ncbi:uncharacterized protein F4817DRAFT_356862 [Daldinia loculata]|uniref:uncharacterized protein n=1 Tax=Daldinia loculata TaxID=103429 RepID=UPI0020C534FB|nr:uncharacterized protein F4817DRAFT_356862 [Daldinia loculata]KAI1650134.1 hypothetical protein F4817DRAFT_356862 [Daldinia loculata]
MTDRIGIPLLAQRIALGPDYEAFIFRKFDQLSARNLLHLESRLGYLEYKLDQADRQAEHGLDNETRRSIRAWEAFEENAKDKDQEALLRQNQIAALEGPRKRALDVVCDQSYINVYDSFGNKSSRRPILAGLSEKRLSEHNHRDLAALRRTPDKDLLSRFLQDHWMFKHCRGSLLLGAIVLLSLLTQKNAQLGVIAMFTVLFAASVGVLTNARMAEIFASTAAYATLLVVFISSSPSNPGMGICTCVPTH